MNGPGMVIAYALLGGVVFTLSTLLWLNLLRLARILRAIKDSGDGLGQIAVILLVVVTAVLETIVVTREGMATPWMVGIGGAAASVGVAPLLIRLISEKDEWFVSFVNIIGVAAVLGGLLWLAFLWDRFTAFTIPSRIGIGLLVLLMLLAVALAIDEGSFWPGGVGLIGAAGALGSSVFFILYDFEFSHWIRWWGAAVALCALLIFGIYALTSRAKSARPSPPREQSHPVTVEGLLPPHTRPSWLTKGAHQRLRSQYGLMPHGGRYFEFDLALSELPDNRVPLKRWFDSHVQNALWSDDGQTAHDRLSAVRALAEILLVSLTARTHRAIVGLLVAGLACGGAVLEVAPGILLELSAGRWVILSGLATLAVDRLLTRFGREMRARQILREALGAVSAAEERIASRRDGARWALGRWTEKHVDSGQTVVSLPPRWSPRDAENVLKARWPELELTVLEPSWHQREGSQ